MNNRDSILLVEDLQHDKDGAIEVIFRIIVKVYKKTNTSVIEYEVTLLNDGVEKEREGFDIYEKANKYYRQTYVNHIQE